MNTLASEVNAAAAQVASDADDTAQDVIDTGIALAQAQAAAASATAAPNVSGTSTTTRTPTVGSQSWVYVETGKLPFEGMRMRAVSRAAPTTNYALGTVASYDAGTRTVTLTVDQVGAAPASASDWNLLLEGEPGQPGEDAEVRSLVQTRSANGTITAADLGATLRCTGTITLTPDSAASLGDGYSVIVDAPGHVVTIDTVGTVPVGGLGLVQSDGTTITLRLLGSQTRMLHVRDEKTSGTSGGGGATGSDQTRPLNTVVINEITGASLASNQVTVPAGVYEIEGYVPGESVAGFRGLLHNVTAGTTVQGNNVTANGTYQGWGMSMVRAKVTLAAPTVFELRMRQLAAPGGSQEWGSSLGISGAIEVYSTLIFRKVG